jgi:AcrR family transcriptional regulator
MIADPPRTVRDLRRGQIVAAARTLVAQGGLDALTFGALERRLDFTRGVITYHFRDKEEIVAAVLESAVEEIDRAADAEVRAGAGADDRLRAVIGSMVGGFAAHAEARTILVSFWSRIPADPQATLLNSRLYASWRKRAAALIRAGQAEGRFAADVRPDAVAATLVALVVGIVVQSAFDPGAVDVDAMVGEATASVLARLKA